MFPLSKHEKEIVRKELGRENLFLISLGLLFGFGCVTLLFRVMVKFGFVQTILDKFGWDSLHISQVERFLNIFYLFGTCSFAIGLGGFLFYKLKEKN